MYTYLLAINIIAFVVYALDKIYAKYGMWRVPELYLLLLALLGGSVGAYTAMQLFRHKTQHFKFKYGVPLLMLIQFVGVFIIRLVR